MAVLVMALLVARSATAQDTSEQAPSAPTTEAGDEEQGGADEPADDAEPDAAEPAPPPQPPPAESPPPVAPDSEGDVDDGELADDLGDELTEEEARRPPAKGMGVVWGRVTDTKFDEPLVEAVVEVVGRKQKAFTDVEGRYRLELRPGTYTIRVSYELHKSARVESLQVAAGRIVEADLELVPDEDAVDTVVVETEVDQQSTEGQTLERKRSATVGDRIGRKEIARTPDRNAAEAAQRVVGATIVGGRFVLVRGLGERYTNALLNGTPLPSPEPDRQAVPLDLFPSLVLDSVGIVKQFMPDMPADFAGGSVRINTREFPKETLLQLSLSGGVDTDATFRRRLGYRGSNTDWLGFDGGSRAMPEGLPAHKLDSLASEEERLTWGRRVNSYLSTLRRGTPPNHGGSVVVGDGFKLGDQSKLGALLALNYGRSYAARKRTVRNYTTEADGVRVLDSYSGEYALDTVRWGAFGSAAWEVAQDHKLKLTLLRSQAADDLTSELEGTSDITGHVQRGTHLEYVSRALNFGELAGEHRFASLNEAELRWHGAGALAARDQPDTRDVTYLKIPASGPRGAGYQYQSGPQSASHVYANQSERTVNGGLDWLQPLFKVTRERAKLKVGGLVTSRSRDFDARRFVIEAERGAALGQLGFCAGEAWNRACPDALFRSELIDGQLLTATESTRQFDSYSAGQQVYATYAMLDTPIVDRIRVIGGARVEITHQHFKAHDPFGRVGTTDTPAIRSTDVLPALSVVTELTKRSQTRFGLSRTLARPQLREITPYLSTSYAADLSVQGNDQLQLTKITNADLRFEHFPTLNEVVGFSFFYKHFTKPIEEVFIPGTQAGIISYENAPKADLLGLELEARKGLGTLSPTLKDFMVIANLTVASSRVDFGNKAGAATNPSRPLSLQSPYVVNVALDYGRGGTDLRALYNIYGPRITRVGQQGIPDVYEQPRHVLDLTAAQRLFKQYELKLAAQNLLGAPVVHAHRGVRRYSLRNHPDGSTTRVLEERDPITRRETRGCVITLSATYTH